MNSYRLLFFSVVISGYLYPNLIMSQTPENKPNVIFILTDDQRFDALGYAGNPYVQTPEMDELAKRGTYFKNAMVTTPICAASRASILTGLHERAHNFNFKTGDIRGSYMENSYPALLKNNGYQTGFFGKYGVRYTELQKQFDIYESYDRNNNYSDRRGYYYKMLDQDTVHLTRYTGQKALDYIDTIDTNKPFCLSLSFSAPHAHDRAKKQYFWQQTTDKILQNKTIPGPKLADDSYFLAQPKFVRDGFNRLRWTWRYDTPEKYQHSLKGYYRMISGIDLEIGKIRKKLKEEGLDKNTVIILMGDNGYFLGERQFAGKWLLYDNSIRVPLIIFDPRNKKHQDIEEMALNVDIPSTILDLAGITPPNTWQGKSLLPIVDKTTKTVDRDTVLIEHIWEFKHIPPSEGIRTDQWKYFRYVNNKSIEELYNLKKDPQEITNLVSNSKYKEVLINLRKKCDELIEKNSNIYRNPPTDLSVELIRKPEDVKITDPKPEFGWVIAKESVFQSAYQILVASSKEKIDHNIGDIWDSKQVRSNASNNVEFEGSTLTTGMKYYWKVRIWDDENRLVDYSDPQSFLWGTTDTMISTANKFLKEKIKPQSMIKKGGDIYLLDFGKDAFASMEFTYTAQEPHTLLFHVGEKLKEGWVDKNPGGHIRYQKIEVPVKKGTHLYQLPVHVDKRNTLPNKAVQLPEDFPVLMPFRYVELHNAKGALQKDAFTQLAFFNYWEEDESTFTSDNEILNQVWDLCKYSIKATTFAGLYVDGDRERIPYEADAYLNQLSHYTTDREYAIARRTMEYFMEYPTWPTEWQQHVALMFHADYMYTGNTELIAKYYDELKHKTLMELRNEKGLVSSTKSTPAFMKKLGFKDPKAELRDITDWPPSGWQGNPEVMGERDGFVFRPYSATINALYYKNMKIMAEFATVLGKNEEAAEFEMLAFQAKKSFNEQFLDKKKGIYIDGIGTDHSSIHANMFPLAFDMVPKKYIASVGEFIKSRGMACSVYGAQYLMEALYKAGEAAYALELLTDQSDRSWYNMIRVGSTITLEAWDMKYKPNADWNHAWGAAPANIIPRGLWGITPKTPGYKIASIQPQLGPLKNSSIEVPTVRGTIKAQYRYDNPRLQVYTLEIPANMVAEFSLPLPPGKELVHNGKKVLPAFETVRLTPGIHEIKLVVNSF